MLKCTTGGLVIKIYLLKNKLHKNYKLEVLKDINIYWSGKKRLQHNNIITHVHAHLCVQKKIQQALFKNMYGGYHG